MDFIYYIFFLALFLLIFFKKIEAFLNSQKEYSACKKREHSLVMQIGDILENSKGTEQYTRLKPKLEQVKRYYKNNDNRNVVPIGREQQVEKEPVQLRVV